MSKKLESIGQRIQYSIKQNNLTQAQLAEKAECSIAHISDIECGKTNMGISTFVHILEALNISSDWVLGVNTASSLAKSKEALSELLDGCTAQEIEIIMDTVSSLKKSLIAARKEED